MVMRPWVRAGTMQTPPGAVKDGRNGGVGARPPRLLAPAGAPAHSAPPSNQPPQSAMLDISPAFANLGTETAFEVLARANALKAAGKDIINLGIGQPDFQTPPHVVE